MMARFIPLAMTSMLLALPAQAQVAASNVTSPWQTSEQNKPTRSFNMVDLSPDQGTAGDKGSMIIAGTELEPNTMFGFGLFGEKSESKPHAPATNRDYTIPSTRRAGVGVALKF